MKAIQRVDIAREPSRVADSVKRQFDAVIGAVNPLLALPLSDGLLVEVSLTTNFQRVAHGLGRAWRGFLVAGTDADARIWYDPDAPTVEKVTTITLRASAATNAKLWVF